MTGLITDVIRRRGAFCSMEETREMICDTKAWRAAVAKQLGISVQSVKKGVQRITFGMSLCKWQRLEGIPDGTRSTKLERLEKEFKEARTLITDDEVKNSRAALTDKSTRILSKAVGRSEEEIICELSAHLKEQGWETSTLIHDEIVICKSNRFTDLNEEVAQLNHMTKLSLRNSENRRGWPPGTLQIDIQRL